MPAMPNLVWQNHGRTVSFASRARQTTATMAKRSRSEVDEDPLVKNLENTFKAIAKYHLKKNNKNFTVAEAKAAGQRMFEMKNSIFDKLRAQVGPAQPVAQGQRLMEPLNQSLVARVSELDKALDELSESVTASRADIPKQSADQVQQGLDDAVAACARAQDSQDCEESTIDTDAWARCLQEGRLEDLTQAFELASSLMAELMTDLPRELQKWGNSVATAEAVVRKGQSQTDAVICESSVVEKRATGVSPKRRKTPTLSSPMRCSAVDVTRQRLLHHLR